MRCARLLSELAHVSDMRHGYITEVNRRRREPSCWCQQGHQIGHGSFFAFTTNVLGKTRTLQLRPRPLVDREVKAYSPGPPTL